MISIKSNLWLIHDIIKEKRLVLDNWTKESTRKSGKRKHFWCSVIPCLTYITLGIGLGMCIFQRNVRVEDNVIGNVR